MGLAWILRQPCPRAECSPFHRRLPSAKGRLRSCPCRHRTLSGELRGRGLAACARGANCGRASSVPRRPRPRQGSRRRATLPCPAPCLGAVGMPCKAGLASVRWTDRAPRGWAGDALGDPLVPCSPSVGRQPDISQQNQVPGPNGDKKTTGIAEAKNSPSHADSWHRRRQTLSREPGASRDQGLRRRRGEARAGMGSLSSGSIRQVPGREAWEGATEVTPRVVCRAMSEERTEQGFAG